MHTIPKELIIESQFSSFLRNHGRKFSMALRGKKLKKRHLKNGYDLLSLNYDGTDSDYADAMFDALEASVLETSSFNGDDAEVNFEDFAKKLRKKASTALRKKSPMGIVRRLAAKRKAKNLSKKQANSPTAALTTDNEAKLEAPMPTQAMATGGGGGNAPEPKADDAKEDDNAEKSTPTEEPKKASKMPIILAVVIIVAIVAVMVFRKKIA